MRICGRILESTKQVGQISYPFDSPDISVSNIALYRPRLSCVIEYINDLGSIASSTGLLHVSTSEKFGEICHRQNMSGVLQPQRL